MRTVLLSLVWVVTLLLACVTATANFHYGMLVGSGIERYVYAVGGTVLDITKTILPTVLATFLNGPASAGLFFRHTVGWSVWALGVAWSIACALGLYAIVKEARIGDVSGQQIIYRQLTADRDAKRAALGSRTIEQVDGDLAALKRNRLWTRTAECASATMADSREYCSRVDRLTAERATVDRLETELRAIDTKLSGIDPAEVMKKADPATDALGRLLGWDGETVKTRLAFLIAVLFECAGLLPWIVLGTHSVARKPDPAPNLTPQVVPAPAPSTDTLTATWALAAIQRSPGAFIQASKVAERFEAWCRQNGHSKLSRTAFGKQMTALGYARKKKGGQIHYADIALGRGLRVVA